MAPIATPACAAARPSAEPVKEKIDPPTDVAKSKPPAVRYVTKYERVGAGLLGAGIPFLVIGALNTVGGLVGVMSYEDPADLASDCKTTGQNCDANSGDLTLPTFSLAVGGAMLAGGVVMTVLGAQKVPVLKQEQVSLAPSVRLGPGHVALDWKF